MLNIILIFFFLSFSEKINLLLPPVKVASKGDLSFLLISGSTPSAHALMLEKLMCEFKILVLLLINHRTHKNKNTIHECVHSAYLQRSRVAKIFPRLPGLSTFYSVWQN